MVRAKFKVTGINLSEGSKPTSDPKVFEPCELKTLILNPVYSPDPKSENYAFWKSSPSGEIRLGCTNPGASDQFKVGKEFYVDFTPVPEQ